MRSGSDGDLAAHEPNGNGWGDSDSGSANGSGEGFGDGFECCYRKDVGDGQSGNGDGAGSGGVADLYSQQSVYAPGDGP